MEKDQSRTRVIREWEASTRHKLPPINHSNRMATERWLKYELDVVEKAIDAHTECLKSTPSEALRAQLTYFKNFRSAIRHLRARNKQRRGYRETT